MTPLKFFTIIRGPRNTKRLLSPPPTANVSVCLIIRPRVFGHTYRTGERMNNLVVYVTLLAIVLLLNLNLEVSDVISSVHFKAGVSSLKTSR